MVKQHKLFVALLGMVALGVFSSIQAEEKKKHDDHAKKGPNGGELIEVGDAEDHHLEFVHDEKAGKLTFYCLKADVKTPYTPKEALKLNVKTKDGNKQFVLTGADSKWETSDEIFKEVAGAPSFEKAFTPRMVVVLPDGKKYNVTLEEHAHEPAPKK